MSCVAAAGSRQLNLVVRMDRGNLPPFPMTATFFPLRSTESSHLAVCKMVPLNDFMPPIEHIEVFGSVNTPTADISILHSS